MMRANHLIGLPVICDTKKIASVLSVSVGHDGHSLSGLVVQSGLYGPRFIPCAQVVLLGDRSVLVSAPAARKPSTIRRPGRVRDTGGLRLGWATDLGIDEQTLGVQAIEVSFGPLDDMLYGLRWLQDFTFDHASGDVVVPWFPLECLECSERRTRDADVDVSGNGGGQRARPCDGRRADDDAART